MSELSTVETARRSTDSNSGFRPLPQRQAQLVEFVGQAAVMCSQG
jgi:hypothetical protein